MEPIMLFMSRHDAREKLLEVIGVRYQDCVKSNQ